MRKRKREEIIKRPGIFFNKSKDDPFIRVCRRSNVDVDFTLAIHNEKDRALFSIEELACMIASFLPLWDFKLLTQTCAFFMCLRASGNFLEPSTIFFNQSASMLPFPSANNLAFRLKKSRLDQSAEFFREKRRADADSRSQISGFDSTIINTVFSPDGTKVVTVLGNRTAKLWDANSSQALSIMQHEGGIYRLYFSPGGTKIVTLSQNLKTFVVWNAATGRVWWELLHDAIALNPLSFSPDGTQLATSSSDKAVRLWCMRTGELLRTFRHSNSITLLRFTYDGDALITITNDQTVSVWIIAKDDECLSIHPRIIIPRTSCCNTMISHNGEKLLIAWDNTNDGVVYFQILDLNSDDPHVRFLDTIEIGGRMSDYNVALSPDGNILALLTEREQSSFRAMHGSKQVILWDIPAQQEIGVLSAENALIYSVIFSPDGTKIALQLLADMVAICDVRACKHLYTIHGRWCYSDFVFSPDSTKIATTTYDAPYNAVPIPHTSLRLWDANSGENLYTVLRSAENRNRFYFSTSILKPIQENHTTRCHRN